MCEKERHCKQTKNKEGEHAKTTVVDEATTATAATFIEQLGGVEREVSVAPGLLAAAIHVGLGVARVALALEVRSVDNVWQFFDTAEYKIFIRDYMNSPTLLCSLYYLCVLCDK